MNFLSNDFWLNFKLVSEPDIFPYYVKVIFPPKRNKENPNITGSETSLELDQKSLDKKSIGQEDMGQKDVHKVSLDELTSNKETTHHTQYFISKLSFPF